MKYSRDHIRTFTYSKSLKYGKRGQVNTFKWFGETVKIFISPDGKTVEIIDAPKSIRDKLKKAQLVTLYKDRLHVRYPKEPKKTEKQQKPDMEPAHTSIMRYVYPIEDRTSRHSSDVDIVANQMEFVERISGFFEPLRYNPVRTCLVDEDVMDRIYPPREVEVDREVDEIAEQIGESLRLLSTNIKPCE